MEAMSLPAIRSPSREPRSARRYVFATARCNTIVTIPTVNTLALPSITRATVAPPGDS